MKRIIPATILAALAIGLAVIGLTTERVYSQGSTGAARRQTINMRAGMVVGANGVKVSQIRCGVTGAMTAGSITVTDANVTANTIIMLTEQSTGGTAGSVRVSSRTAGTSFVITSTSGTDTGTVGYCMIEP